MATLKIGGKPASAEAVKYKHIRSWGIYMRSFEYYIKGQQEQAAKDGAPVDSVYFNTHLKGKWVTIADFGADHPFHAFHEAYWKGK